MSNDLVNKLKNIQLEVSKNNLTLKRLTELSNEARKAFDKSFEQLLETSEYLPKIKLTKTRYIISMPFIYGMIIPSLFFHFSIELYHQVCFRLYSIPLVKSSDYFLYDRKLLKKLNLIEKINCIYCSYVNNLISYASEIGGRTERYWCPIKYSRKLRRQHSQYNKFFKETDIKELHSHWEELRDFSDIEEK